MNSASNNSSSHFPLGSLDSFRNMEENIDWRRPLAQDYSVRPDYRGTMELDELDIGTGLDIGTNNLDSDADADKNDATDSFNSAILKKFRFLESSSLSSDGPIETTSVKPAMITSGSIGSSSSSSSSSKIEVKSRNGIDPNGAADNDDDIVDRVADSVGFDKIFVKTALSDRRRLMELNKSLEKDIVKLNRKVEDAHDKFTADVVLRGAARKWRLLIAVLAIMERRYVIRLATGFHKFRSQVAKVKYWSVKSSLIRLQLKLAIKNVALNHIQAKRSAFQRIKNRSTFVESKLEIHFKRQDVRRLLICWQKLRSMQGDIAKRKKMVENLFFKMKRVKLLGLAFRTFKAHCIMRHQWQQLANHKLKIASLIRNYSRLRLRSSFDLLNFNAANRRLQSQLRRSACTRLGSIVTIKLGLSSKVKESWDLWKAMNVKYSFEKQASDSSNRNLLKCCMLIWGNSVQLIKQEKKNLLKFCFSYWLQQVSDSLLYKKGIRHIVFCRLLQSLSIKLKKSAQMRYFVLWRVKVCRTIESEPHELLARKLTHEVDSYRSRIATLEATLEAAKMGRLRKMVRLYSRDAESNQKVSSSFWSWNRDTHLTKVSRLNENIMRGKLEIICALLSKHVMTMKHLTFLRLKRLNQSTSDLGVSLEKLCKATARYAMRWAVKKWVNYLASQVGVWRMRNRIKEREEKSASIIVRLLRQYCLRSYLSTWHSNTVEHHIYHRRLYRMFTITRLAIVRLKFQTWRSEVNKRMYLKFHEFYQKKISSNFILMSTFRVMKERLIGSKDHARRFVRCIFTKIRLNLLGTHLRKWFINAKINKLVVALRIVTRRLQFTFSRGQLLRAFHKWRSSLAMEESEKTRLVRESIDALRCSNAEIKQIRKLSVFHFQSKLHIKRMSHSFSNWKGYSIVARKAKQASKSIYRLIFIHHLRKSFKIWSFLLRFGDAMKRKAFCTWSVVYRRVKLRKKSLRLILQRQFERHSRLLLMKSFYRWSCNKQNENGVLRRLVSKVRSRTLSYSLQLWIRRVKEFRSISRLLSLVRRKCSLASFSKWKLVVAEWRWRHAVSKSVVKLKLGVIVRYFNMRTKTRLFNQFKRFYISNIRAKKFIFATLLKTRERLISCYFNKWKSRHRFDTYMINEIKSNVSGFGSSIVSSVFPVGSSLLVDINNNLDSFPAAVLFVIDRIETLFSNLYSLSINVIESAADPNLAQLLVGQKKFNFNNKVQFTGVPMDDFGRGVLANNNFQIQYPSTVVGGNAGFPTIEMSFLINRGLVKASFRLFPKHNSVRRQRNSHISTNTADTAERSATSSSLSAADTFLLSSDIDRILLGLSYFHDLHQFGAGGSKASLQTNSLEGRIIEQIRTRCDDMAPSAGKSTPFHVVALAALLVELFTSVTCRASSTNIDQYHRSIAHNSDNPSSKLNFEAVTSTLPLSQMSKTEIIEVLRTLESEYKLVKGELKTNRKRLFFIEHYKRKLQKDGKECRDSLRACQETSSALRRSVAEQAAVIARLTGQSKAGRELINAIQKGYDALSSD